MIHFWPFGKFFTGIRFDAFTAEKHRRKRALVHDCSGKSLKSSSSRSQNDHSSQDLSLYELPDMLLLELRACDQIKLTGKTHRK